MTYARGRRIGTRSATSGRLCVKAGPPCGRSPAASLDRATGAFCSAHDVRAAHDSDGLASAIRRTPTAVVPDVRRQTQSPVTGPFGRCESSTQFHRHRKARPRLGWWECLRQRPGTVRRRAMGWRRVEHREARARSGGLLPRHHGARRRKLLHGRRALHGYLHVYARNGLRCDVVEGRREQFVSIGPVRPPAPKGGTAADLRFYLFGATGFEPATP